MNNAKYRIELMLFLNDRLYQQGLISESLWKEAKLGILEKGEKQGRSF